MKRPDVREFCMGPERPIREAIALMDKHRLGIVLVTDAACRLLGVLTDGDMRRAVLARRDLEAPVSVILKAKEGTLYARPVTAPAGTDPGRCLRILREHRLDYLPLLDSGQRVVGFVTLDEFTSSEPPALSAVVMAGGKGTRLYPLTKETPKPMLPVGDKPLMEILIGQLREAGIRKVSVATHFQGSKISDYFGDGSGFGVDVSYVNEDRPLGTAGALSLLEPPKETLLVINGDILTDIDFRALRAYHREMAAELTVAVTQFDLQVPYGVVECDGALVRRIAEKPTYPFLIGAGIYLIEPAAFAFIPKGQRLDMPELIEALVREGRRVASFPIREYWLDIGQHTDYARAQEEAARLRKPPERPEP